MSPSELQQLLVRAGIETRIKGNEVQIHVCVWCGNAKWNLELNAERGLGHCWVCKKGGRLDRILKELTGESYSIRVQKQERTAGPGAAVASDINMTPVTEIPSALVYLEKRGIDALVVKAYGLKFVSHPGHLLDGRIAVPVRDYWSGEVLGWTGRSYTGKPPKYVSTLPRKIVTGWRQRAAVPTVIVEGPFDGIAAHRAGFNAAVLSGIAGGDVTDWAARVQGPLVIMLDGDAQQQAASLYWAISAVRAAPLHILLQPYSDPASIGPAEIVRLVTEALKGAT